MQIPARQRGRQMHGRRLIVGANRATNPARRGIQTCGAPAHVRGEDALCRQIAGVQKRRKPPIIQTLGHDRPMHRNERHAEPACCLLRQQFADSRFRRRQQHAGRGIRRVLQSLVRTVHTDQAFDAVVVRRDLFVRDRPVAAQAIARVRFEIVGTIAKRDAAPVIGASAEHARSPPPELTQRIIAGARVRLARNLPAAIDRGIVEAEGFVGRAFAAQRRHEGRVKHRCFAIRGIAAAGFEHQHLHAFERQRVGRLPARGAGADDNHVEFSILGCAGSDKRHGSFSEVAANSV